MTFFIYLLGALLSYILVILVYIGSNSYINGRTWKNFINFNDLVMMFLLGLLSWGGLIYTMLMLSIDKAFRECALEGLRSFNNYK